VTGLRSIFKRNWRWIRKLMQKVRALGVDSILILISRCRIHSLAEDCSTCSRLCSIQSCFWSTIILWRSLMRLLSYRTCIRINHSGLSRKTVISRSHLAVASATLQRKKVVVKAQNHWSRLGKYNNDSNLCCTHSSSSSARWHSASICSLRFSKSSCKWRLWFPTSIWSLC
jgi:hypothetical protein